MENLLKTIDALKMPSLSSSESSIPGTISSAVVAASDSVKTKKKERITHCRAVTDAVCNPGVQGLTDYGKILENVTEVLFLLCNDSDSDIRSVASDCLNRIARTLKDSFQPKFHMEIYREIRKNQSPRSLRTALNLFAFICPMIRPQKCRAFLSSLLPCFSQIVRRTEESLYENLASAVTEIFKYLGPFAHDSEIKILCKDFMANLESNSAIVRRASASILVAVSLYSKHPWITLPQLLSKATDLLMPNLMEKNVYVILGVLICVRQCIPHIYKEINEENLDRPPELDNVVANLLQVYEMCMILCNHDDHNVITTSLETLQQLFTSPPETFLIKITSSSGIQNSLDEKTWNIRHSLTAASASAENLVFSDEASNLLDSDDVPKFRSVTDTLEGQPQLGDGQSILSSSRRDSDVFIIEGTLSDASSTEGMHHHSDDEERMEPVGENPKLLLPSFPEIQIGSLYEENIPIYYCARFLAYNFLLSGQKGVIRPDSEVRVSIKALATNCIANLISVRHEIFKLHLSHALIDAGNDESQQQIEDMILYCSHSDPLLRGTTYFLIGNYLSAMLQNSLGRESSDTSSLLELLRNGTRDDSNVGVKCAVLGIRSCLSSLLMSPSDAELGKGLLEDLLLVSLNAYWLVKVDLVELLSSLNWRMLNSCENIVKKILSVLYQLIRDEDPRVRAVASSSIAKFLKTSTYWDTTGWGPPNLLCKECVGNEVNLHRSVILGRRKIHCISCDMPFPSGTNEIVETVLQDLFDGLKRAEDKHSIAGYYTTLSQISDILEPRSFRPIWDCINGVSNIQSLFAVCMDTLRSSPVVYDVVIHQSSLNLAGNLFLGLDFFKLGSSKDKSPEEGNPFRCHNVQVAKYGMQLLQHSLAVMKLYRSIFDSISSSSSFRKQSTSPVISPVKKFSQKLEAEKKAQEAENEKKGKAAVFSETICPQHFKALHDAIVQSWRVYKANLDPVVTSKFTSLLNTAISTVRKMFFCIRPDYPLMSSLIGEILTVSSSLFHVCPVAVLQNVREMLKCIFSLYDPDLFKVENVDRIDTKNDLEDFLTFSKTYENVLLETRSREKSVSKLMSDKSSLGTYIRQFESAVVTALRIYTTNGDPEVQSEVLALLVQLIKGHVNYGLVDSNQVFLGFVKKQVSLLEEGYLRNPTLMIKGVFQFLVVLSHESLSSKKFIGLLEIANLCSSLVSTVDNLPCLVEAAVCALKFLVYDLFIYRGGSSHTNQEKKEYESHTDTVIEMMQKLVTYPEILPTVWLLLKGRKLSNEAKWISGSEMFVTAILSALLKDKLRIANLEQFSNLVALLYSVHPSSLPSEDHVLDTLSEKGKQEISNLSELGSWCVKVNCYWTILTKIAIDENRQGEMNPDIAKLFMALLEKALVEFTKNFRSVAVPSTEFCINQIGIFLKISGYLFKPSEASENVTQELKSSTFTSSFMSVARCIVDLGVLDAKLRLRFMEFLSSLHYPKTNVWEVLLQPSASFPDCLLHHSVIRIINTINEGDVPPLEEWIIVNHSEIILAHITHPDIAIFIRRLSTYRMEQIMDQITILVQSPLSVSLAKSILIYFERVSDSFLCETAILSMKIIKQAPVDYIALEASQFTCFILSQIHTRKLLFSSRDREFLLSFLNDHSHLSKYPRLMSLLKKVLCEESSSPIGFKRVDATSLIMEWCSNQINSSEAFALTRMLSSLKYPQVSSVLSSSKFNVSLLPFAFISARKAQRIGVVSSVDVIDLFTSEKRPNVIEKMPFAVAAVDYILETLDSWENLASDFEIDGHVDKLLKNTKLANGIIPMWSTLTEMLILKKSALRFRDKEAKEWCNNFIPTGIFTLSFEFMAQQFSQTSSNNIPFDTLGTFLRFASIALYDPTFLSFFDLRDNSKYLFVCVKSMGIITRKLIADLRIEFCCNNSETDSSIGMTDDCVDVLNGFHFLMEFIQYAEGRVHLDADLFRDFRSVVAGLGRCELVNGWILISHLGWKPQVLSKTTIFPPIQQIPLEILRNEVDMLLKYIAKLTLLGVASKIQFEENWVIFLSVINLYVDESFQLQIVSTGLRALSMMLQQSIKIEWSWTAISPLMESARAKIDDALEDLEPVSCNQIDLRNLNLLENRQIVNPHGIDINSCIRFLTDLYSQWLQNPQGKMPLQLLGEVIQSIVVLSEYFEDQSQYAWMHETLTEIHKSLDKEDEMLWPHLMYGIFYAATKLDLETEGITALSQQLEGLLSNPFVRISNVGLKCALVYLQSHPECLPIINAVLPHASKSTQLDQMTSDSETHCLRAWTVMLFVWMHGPNEGLVIDLDQDIVRNILTALSPLNKVFVSARLLLLKALRLKVERGNLKPEVKKMISKVTLETFRTTNVSIFFEAVKLYLTTFYDDFAAHVDKSDLDPEVLMPIAERADLLFTYLRSKTKCHNRIVSRVLPLIISDYLPPSEILNRVIAEFLAATQPFPELVAPAVAQVFEKAKRRPKEATLVREWILASLPNFIASGNCSRVMWSLTILFIGVSSSSDLFCLLPFSQLRHDASQIKELFIHATLDLYSSLDEKQKLNFKKLMREGPFHPDDPKRPYEFLMDILDKVDKERGDIPDVE